VRFLDSAGWLVALVIVGGALVTRAAASVQVSADAFYMISSNPGVGDHKENASQFGELPVSAVVDIGLDDTAAYAVSTGSAKGQEIFCAGRSSREIVGIECLCSAFSFTFFTPHAPGLDGEVAFVTAQLSVSDELRLAPGDSFYTLQAEVDFAVEQGITYLARQSGDFFGGDQSWRPDSFGSFTATFPLTIGEETSFYLGVASRALFGTFEHAPVDSSFGMSISWLGVSSVTDTQGRPIDGFTLTDENGVNWLTAVPEPASLAWASGALILVRRPRRRRV
jgi:hypothetical protein